MLENYCQRKGGGKTMLNLMNSCITSGVTEQRCSQTELIADCRSRNDNESNCVYYLLGFSSFSFTFSELSYYGRNPRPYINTPCFRITHCGSIKDNKPTFARLNFLFPLVFASLTVVGDATFRLPFILRSKAHKMNDLT